MHYSTRIARSLAVTMGFIIFFLIFSLGSEIQLYDVHCLCMGAYIHTHTHVLCMLYLLYLYVFVNAEQWNCKLYSKEPKFNLAVIQKLFRWSVGW